jgi:dTDP-4-dehydrorhamnose reductase
MARSGRQVDMPEMSCVVVSGARGLLGATLMRVLPDAGFRAIPLTCDIRDAAAVTKQIAQAAPAHVVHAAAMTYVANCMRQPQEAFAVNGEGTKNVVEAARAASARILYISTASVFKGDHGDYREEDAPEPTNAYNQSKREGEWYALDYDGGIVLRFNLIGIHPDGSRGTNFFEWLVDGFRANEDITLFADACINPLSNWTVAALAAKILTRDRLGKILHIGSRDVLSKAAIGELVRARFPGYRGTLRSGSVDAVGDGVFRPKQMWLNTQKAAALLDRCRPWLRSSILFLRDRAYWRRLARK